MEDQITNKDILEAISLFSSNVDEKFAGIDQRFDGIDQRLDGIDQRFDGIDQRFDSLETKMEKGFTDIRAEIKEVKAELLAKIDALDKRSDEDTCANMTDYLKLKVRVEKLEKQFGQMQPA